MTTAKPKKNLTPGEAYKRLEDLAKKSGMSVSAYAEKKGVKKSTVSHWRRRKQRTVLFSTLEKLGLMEA